MKTLHSLVAGFRPASLILARRVVLALLVLTAGLLEVQPCASAPFEFQETGSLNTARYLHTATLLRNGKVLVAGGEGLDSESLTSAELYDPASGTWTATGRLNTARFLHTATLLPNGKVAVTGGYNSNVGNLASAELYDPASGTWTAVGGLLPTARDRHTATLLANHQMIVAGGFNGGALASTELYHPASRTWVTSNL